MKKNPKKTNPKKTNQISLNPLVGIDIMDINVDFETFINQVSKTFLDLSFQRDGGWGKDDKLSFLKLTKDIGGVLTPIYICDNNECYKNAPDEETKMYFFDLLQRGYRYLSIDGNNRSVTLVSHRDTIINEDWIILSKTILVRKITKIKKSGIPFLFNYLNSGLKQSNQVMTNTYSYDLSSAVRVISNKYKSISLFSKYSGKNNEELVSRCLMLVDNYLSKDKESNFISLDPKSIRKFFKKNHESLKLQTNTIKMTNDILQRMDDIILPNISSLKSIRTGQVYYLNMFMLLLIDYKTTKINNRNFLNTFISIEYSFRSSKNIEYDRSVRDHSKKHVECRYQMVKSYMTKHESNFVVLIPIESI
jgi:hypothetical protein